MFAVIFDNPEMISIGSEKDELVVEILDPKFFASSNNG